MCDWETFESFQDENLRLIWSQCQIPQNVCKTVIEPTIKNLNICRFISGLEDITLARKEASSALNIGSPLCLSCQKVRASTQKKFSSRPEFIEYRSHMRIRHCSRFRFNVTHRVVYILLVQSPLVLLLIGNVLSCR